MQPKLILAATILSLAFSSCNKEIVELEPVGTTTPTSPAAEAPITGTSWVNVGDYISGAGHGLLTFEGNFI